MVEVVFLVLVSFWELIDRVSDLVLLFVLDGVEDFGNLGAILWIVEVVVVDGVIR